MKFAVSEMSFAPPLATPVTDEYFMQVTQSLDDCLAAREIHWQYSLVSVKGERSICVYRVPYAEAAREAYREAGMPFQRIWSGRSPLAIPQVASKDLVVVVEANHDISSYVAALPAQYSSPVVLSSNFRALAFFPGATIEHLQPALLEIATAISIGSIWSATLLQRPSHSDTSSV